MGAVFAMTADEPLFRNADHALRFAYGRRASILDSVRYLTEFMIKSVRATGLGALTREDRIAQAAMILAFVARLPPSDQACIVARYTRDGRRQEAQQFLTKYVLPCLTGVTHRRMVDELVARHYGKRVHLGMLAKRFGVHRDTITAKRATVERELQRIELRADNAVIEYLKGAGLLHEQSGFDIPNLGG